MQVVSLEARQEYPLDPHNALCYVFRMQTILIRLTAIIAVFSAISAVSADEITIGLLADITGTNAANGVACREGFDVAKDWSGVSGTSTKVKFVYGDHQGNASLGLSEFRKMADIDKISAVVMTRAQVTAAVNPVSKALGIPLLATVGQKTFISDNPYAFRYWLAPGVEGARLAAEALRLGFRRAAVLTLQDEYTLAVSEGYERTFKAGGGEIAESEEVSLSDGEFSSIFTRIRRASPDHLYINLTIAQLGLAVRKAREMGLAQPLFSNLWSADKSVIDTAGIENIKGTRFVTLDLNKPEFQKRFKHLFPESKAIATSYGYYAALSAVLDVVRNGADNRDSVFSALSDLKSVALLDEALPVENREVMYHTVIREINTD